MNAPNRPSDFDDFDPYYRWLGISKSMRPPTYYQLLGVTVTESDQGVIEAASKRHLHYVRQFRGTEHDAIANSLIYEIELATVTLLSGQLRGEYDLTLKSRKIPQKVWQQRKRTPTYRPSGSVGEGSEFLSSFTGIMGVIILGILLMAGASFYLPWQKVVFSGSSQDSSGSTETDNGEGVFGRRSSNSNLSNQQASSPQANDQSVVASEQKPSDAGPPQNQDSASPETTEDNVATIEAFITKINSDSRTLSLKHKSRVAEFDVSRSAVIIIDGKAASLETLRPGQFVNVEFNPEFDVASKIEVLPEPPIVADTKPDTPPEAEIPAASGNSPPSEPKVVNADEDHDSDTAVSIDAAISAVNLDQRSLTLTYNSKSITLELTGETRVTVEGKDAEPESIAVGQTGVITFEPEFDVITKIEITGTGPTDAVTPESHKSETVDDSNLVTADVTIESVDSEQRTINVKLKDKSSSFDVSRKAMIRIDGVEKPLGELPTGSVASITFDAELEVNSEISITTSAQEPQEKNESP